MGDPVFLARRQSRVAGEDPQPPMSNDIHRLPEHKLCAYNMGNPTVVLNKTPQLKMSVIVDIFFDPPFLAGIPLRSNRKGWEEPPPMTVHRNWSITCHRLYYCCYLARAHFLRHHSKQLKLKPQLCVKKKK